jgi:hypothetical protein
VIPTLLTASTTGSGGLNLKGLVVLAVLFVVFQPIQKRFRAWVSRRRIERWEQDGLLGPPPPVDEPPVDEPPGAPSSGPQSQGPQSQGQPPEDHSD